MKEQYYARVVYWPSYYIRTWVCKTLLQDTK